MKLQTAREYLEALHESRKRRGETQSLTESRIALLDELLEEAAVQEVARHRLTERLDELGID